LFFEFSNTDGIVLRVLMSKNTIEGHFNMDRNLIYFRSWYPLPYDMPVEIERIIYAFVFDALRDPW